MLTAYLKRVVDTLSLGLNTILNRGPDRLLFLIVRYFSWKLQFQNRVSNLPPKANLLLTSLTIAWLNGTIRLFRLAVPHKYTDADPYRILLVDPNEITYISGLHDKKRRGWVIGGDWDRGLGKFEDQPIPKAIEQHYLEGKGWEDTVLSEEFDDRRQFERECERIERLYQQIVDHGFRSQRDLLNSNPETAWSGVNATLSTITNEITIDIGREGELLWNMLGRHRLAIAKVTDVERVPVLVFSRHREWQKIRNESNSHGELPREHHGHPDLKCDSS